MSAPRFIPMNPSGDANPNVSHTSMDAVPVPAHVPVSPPSIVCRTRRQTRKEEERKQQARLAEMDSFGPGSNSFSSSSSRSVLFATQIRIHTHTSARLPVPKAPPSIALYKCALDIKEDRDVYLELIETRNMTNPVFLLAKMINEHVRNDVAYTDTMFRSVISEALSAAPCSSWDSTGHFDHLSAEDVAFLIENIDSRHFCGAISAVFKYHGRILNVIVTDDDESATNSAAYSRYGINHYITVNENMFLRAFVVCAFPFSPSASFFFSLLIPFFYMLHSLDPRKLPRESRTMCAA
jgi:hypothetical protein